MNATGDSYESWTGLEADVIRHLCGSGYLEDCTFFKVYDLDGRIDALINGSADVSISGISVTAERAEKAQYVHPYYFEYNGFLYTDADGLQRITTYGDIEGKDVCVLQNSSYIGVLESQYGARVVPIDVREQAAEFIGNGSCVAWAGDPVFSFPKDVGLERVDLPPFTAVPMGAMVALDAPEYLVSSLQAGISSLFQDGQDSLILKYEDANLVEPGLIPGEGSILSQVEAISSFATPLEISQNVMNGSSAGVAAGDQFNVTIAVWTENLPPLANFAEGSFKAFLDPEGSSWSGIEVDLLQTICSKDTIVCNPDLVEVQTLDDRLNVLKNGSADISIGAITVTTDRLEQVPFVRPFYYSSGLGLFTDDENYEEFSGETEPGFLRGKNVCSQEGSAWTGFLDQYGATVVSVADQDAAIKAIKNGNCIAFAYDSFYAISGLKELPLFLPDTQLPYGIAMSQDAPSGLYSELASTVIDGLSDGPDSFLLKAQEQESKTFNTAENPNLENVTDIITNLVVTQEQETSAEEEAVAPEENATESPIPIPSLAEDNQSESSSTREILRLGRLIAVSLMMSAAFLL
jgi:ABC-type amino acid transport substrate-binding protein